MRNSMVTMMAPARKLGSSECRLRSCQASTSSVAHLDIGEADAHVARHQAAAGTHWTAAGIVADDLAGRLRARRAGLNLRAIKLIALPARHVALGLGAAALLLAFVI